MPEEGGAEEKVAYAGRLLRVVLRRTPRGVRELVEHPGAVAILVTDEKGRVLLVRQYREGPGKELWEIPAGTLEPGEKPYACAQRELREETGLSVRLRFLGVIHPTPGYSTERIFLFATEASGEALASGEIEEVRFFTKEEVLELARRGEGDGKTLAALALWKREGTHGSPR
ncbi:MAG: NUDIX hydrolase [Candidatus Bipolaricaulaceae bacterium]